MPGAGVLAVGAAAAILYLGGGAAYRGLKHVGTKVVHVLKHKKPAPKTEPKK